MLLFLKRTLLMLSTCICELICSWLKGNLNIRLDLDRNKRFPCWYKMWCVVTVCGKFVHTSSFTVFNFHVMWLCIWYVLYIKLHSFQLTLLSYTVVMSHYSALEGWFTTVFDPGGQVLCMTFVQLWQVTMLWSLLWSAVVIALSWTSHFNKDFPLFPLLSFFFTFMDAMIWTQGLSILGN